MARILVVDDEPIVRTFVARVLAAHQVVAVADGLAALEVLAVDPCFDVLLTDFDMPRMDGAELIRALAAVGHALAARCVMLTGDPAGALVAMGDRTVPILAKPLTRGALALAIERLVRSAAPVAR